MFLSFSVLRLVRAAIDRAAAPSAAPVEPAETESEAERFATTPPPPLESAVQSVVNPDASSSIAAAVDIQPLAPMTVSPTAVGSTPSLATTMSSPGASPAPPSISVHSAAAPSTAANAAAANAAATHSGAAQSGAPRSNEVPSAAVAIGPSPLVSPAPAAPAGSTTAPHTVPPASAEADPYELLEALGQGQMGTVWKARHRRLGRIAAVKTLSTSDSDDVDIGRFKREAKLVSELRTPHIVTLYDFGERFDGTLYFAMELLDGVDLQRLVSDYGPMPAGRVLKVMTHVCMGLSVAHAAGIVHRDLKPQNILLCRKGAELDVAKILDFGLAKGEPSDGPPSSSCRITREGLVLGTPAYVAPESLDGSHDVDGRADLYALGCIAFWLLSGELVFPYDQPIPMIKAHKNETPRSPSAVSRTKIPPALDTLILQLLAKLPTERPASADEVLAKLAGIRAARSWTDDMAQAWWSSHRPSITPDEPK